MAEVRLYCEDLGHESFARALLERLASDVGVVLEVRVASSRGGSGRALSEFKAWQRSLARGRVVGVPDLLVIIIDGNCTTWRVKKAEILGLIDEDLFPRHVVGCPDPHVERWCFADPEAFRDTVGQLPPDDPDKCERSLYKNLLRNALREAGQPIVTDEMEIAPDLVDSFDLDRACNNDRSLADFLRDLRPAFRQLAMRRTQGE